MNNEQLENGKYIYDFFKENRNLKLTQAIKALNIDSNVGRRDFWSYIILDKCGVKDRLGDKEYILNGYKGYLLSNYSKFFKGINIFDEFSIDIKDFIFNFFMSTYSLTDSELREKIDKEIENMISYYMLAHSPVRAIEKDKDIIKEQKTLDMKNKNYERTILDLKDEYHSLCNLNEELNRSIEFYKDEVNHLKERNKDLEKIIKEDNSIFLIKIDLKTKLVLLSLLVIDIITNLIK